MTSSYTPKVTYQINPKYAQLNMQTSFAMTNWPEIKYWGTTTMYFYQNGKLVSQLIRWSKEGQKQALIDALTGVELLD